MKSNLISKILGVGVAASTVIALGGALLVASPVAADTTKWTDINTPNWEDGVILPSSDIIDYTVSGENGEVIYVIAEVDRECDDGNPFLADDIGDDFGDGGGYGVFKSTDGGVTWKDITQNVLDTDNLPDFNEDNNDADGEDPQDDILSLNYIASAPDDADWVAVTGYGYDPDGDSYAIGGAPNDYPPFTVASKDGGDNFAYAGDMVDNDNDTSMDIVYDTEVSPEYNDLHVVAAMGASNGEDNGGADQQGIPEGPNFDEDEGTVFLLNAGTWLTGSWEDAGYFDGWDGSEDGNNEDIGTKTIHSLAIIDGEFSPNYPDDCGLVVIGMTGFADADEDYPIYFGIPYVQEAIITDEQWGDEASLPGPVKIEDGSTELWVTPGIWTEAVSLPADFDVTDPGARVLFGYVNAIDSTTLDVDDPGTLTDASVLGFVFRLDDEDVSAQVAPSGDPLLASIDVNGDADTGKMMIGEYVQWDDDAFELMTPEDEGVDGPCDGVRVWHTEELDICCPKWELCCKCPCGPYAARVTYTPDGTKQYAVTSGSEAEHSFHSDTPLPPEGFGNLDFVDDEENFLGNPGDESSFSVSLDDATSWNTIGLIDTDIDRLSDMVICPDCSVIYLSTINDGEFPENESFSGCEDTDCDWQGDDWKYGCDAVWRTFDNGDTWERVLQGDWTNEIFTTGPALLLRLPCEDTENCCDYTDPSAPGGTVYLGIQAVDETDTEDSRDMFYSRDCGQCWTETPDTKIAIQDFAVDTESTVYVLDIDGNVSKSTNFGRRWADEVDTGAGSGHMITVCCAQGFVVVGPDNSEGGDAVAWSDDGGDSWTTTDDIPIDGQVHVACATSCENIIYIAVDPMDDSESAGLIYRTDITDGAWDDMEAVPADYTGIAVGRSDGTLYASVDYIGYTESDLNDDNDIGPCDRVWSSDLDECDEDVPYVGSAVARNLTPCETACCGTEDWDYLVCGLDTIPCEGDDCPTEDFDSQTNALDICGCLTSATNTKLWAIDNNFYDVSDGSEGTIRTYEDCASKVGPTLISPAADSVIDCQACEGCGASPFTLKWNRICNACSYDVEIMDEDGNVVISLVDITVTGTTCTFYFNPGDREEFFEELVCGSSYQWHVREANTDCECIHSRWSDTWNFTVATSSLNGVQLIAPTMAATDIGTTNIGFSWTSVPDATSYSFVLSPNANLSGALVSQEIGTTAFNYAGPLDNGKTYYWQVKAWKGTTLLSTSPVGVFTVGPAPVAPQPPVVVQQTPPPVINIPPAQQITPTWIYAIIGIGAALAVVVIVLIVRTRRP